MHRMWTEDEVAFDGEFYTVDKPINEPKSAGETHPPLWIGGGGEKESPSSSSPSGATPATSAAT